MDPIVSFDGGIMKKEDLKRFCDTEGYRHTLAEPWSTEKHTYASNGHIIIRVPRMADVPERSNAPKIDGTLLGEAFEYGPEKWYPIPKITAPKEQECPSCKGSGEITKCHECGCELPIRDGVCSDCDGTGYILKHISVEVAGALFSDVYLYDIGRLEGAEIAPRGAMESARFRFNGGDGLLMPRKS